LRQLALLVSRRQQPAGTQCIQIEGEHPSARYRGRFAAACRGGVSGTLASLRAFARGLQALDGILDDAHAPKPCRKRAAGPCTPSVIKASTTRTTVTEE